MRLTREQAEQLISGKRKAAPPSKSRHATEPVIPLEERGSCRIRCMDCGSWRDHAGGTRLGTCPECGSKSMRLSYGGSESWVRAGVV